MEQKVRKKRVNCIKREEKNLATKKPAIWVLTLVKLGKTMDQETSDRRKNK